VLEVKELKKQGASDARTPHTISLSLVDASRLKLSRAITAVLLFTAACCLVYSLPPISYPDGFFGGVETKDNRLASIKTPKVVLVGGSNLAYGIVSPMIESELRMPTVNMGISANLGLRFMLEEVRASINKGDIIIISPEHQLFFGLLDGTKDLFRVVQAHPPSFRWIFSAYIARIDNLPKLLKNFKELMSAKFHLWYRCFVENESKDALYPNEGKKSRFNAYGDYLASDTLDSTKFEDQEIWPTCEIDWEALNALNDFSEKARSKWAHVFLIAPPTADTSYRTSAGKVQALYEDFDRYVKIPVIGRPDRYVFLRHQCLDAPYHLKSEPRHIRTAHLIEDVKNQLDKEMSP